VWEELGRLSSAPLVLSCGCQLDSIIADSYSGINIVTTGAEDIRLWQPSYGDLRPTDKW
jgi:hypothetical protein